jgi:hypothetical protein
MLAEPKAFGRRRRAVHCGGKRGIGTGTASVRIASAVHAEIAEHRAEVAEIMLPAERLRRDKLVPRP